MKFSRRDRCKLVAPRFVARYRDAMSTDELRFTRLRLPINSQRFQLVYRIIACRAFTSVYLCSEEIPTDEYEYVFRWMTNRQVAKDPSRKRTMLYVNRRPVHWILFEREREREREREIELSLLARLYRLTENLSYNRFRMSCKTHSKVTNKRTRADFLCKNRSGDNRRNKILLQSFLNLS